MATKQSPKVKSKKVASLKKLSPKKILMNEMKEILVPNLEKLKKLIGEKKFEKRIKKVTKILADGVEQPKVKKVPAKKAAKRKKVLAS